MRSIQLALLLCSIATVGVSAPSPVTFAKDPRWTPLDLQPHANQLLEEDFLPRHYAGDNFSEFERGDREFEGVPFHVGEKLIQAAGKFIPDHPSEAGPIEVDRFVETLYILHGARWGAYGERGDNVGHWVADGTPIGYYEVVYEDNDARAIPIVYGEDVRDWWSVWDDERPTKRSVVAWTGSNPHLRTRREAQNTDAPLRLYLTTWKNPRPNARVASVTMHSLNQTAAPFCMAMTARNGAKEMARHIAILKTRRDFLKRVMRKYEASIAQAKKNRDSDDRDDNETRRNADLTRLVKAKMEFEQIDREIESLESSEEPPRPATFKPGVTFAIHTVAEEEGENTTPAIDPGDGAKLHLVHPPILTEKNVVVAEIVPGEDRHPTINISLDEAGGKIMEEVTAERGGKLAILINGKFVAAPVIRSKIGAKFTIEGSLPRADWEKLVE